MVKINKCNPYITQHEFLNHITLTLAQKVFSPYFQDQPYTQLVFSTSPFLCVCESVSVCLTLFPMLQLIQRRMRRRRSTALAEERASSSQTCDREYSLGTNKLSGMRRRRMWRKSLSFTPPVKPDFHFLPLHTTPNTCC